MAVKAMKGDLMIALRLPNLSNDGRKSVPLKIIHALLQMTCIEHQDARIYQSVMQ